MHRFSHPFTSPHFRKHTLDHPKTIQEVKGMVRAEMQSLVGMISVRSIATVTILLYAASKICSLWINYNKARRTGFPVVVAPFPSTNFIWLVLGPVLFSVAKNYAPEWLFERIAICTYGWEFELPTLHDKLGKCFVIATLDSCDLWYDVWS